MFLLFSMLLLVCVHQQVFSGDSLKLQLHASSIAFSSLRMVRSSRYLSVQTCRSAKFADKI